MVIRSARLRPKRSRFHTIIRVAGAERLEAARKGRALGHGSGDALVLEDVPAPGTLQRGELQAGRLVIGVGAGVAVFHDRD